MVNFLKALVFFIIFPSLCHAFNTEARQAVLFDLDSQTVLFEKNASEIMTPSSMSKLMTIYIAFDLLNKGDISLEHKLKVDERAWKTGGTKMFLEIGHEVSIEELIRGVVIQSGNDAAITLAEGIAGDEDKFANLMNVYAEKLGLGNSKFANATGFPDPDHYMTSHDLITLATRLYIDFPQYFHYFAEKEFTHNNITQPNRNALIGNMGIDGMKTGSTEAGGYGLVVSANKDGRRLFAVVNGLKSYSTRDNAALDLIKHGYDDFSITEVLPAERNLGQINVWYGQTSSVPLTLTKDVLIASTNKVLSDDINVALKYNEPLIAPIKQGDVIAHLHVTHDGKTQIIDITADRNVQKSSWFRKMFQNLSIIIERNFNNYTSSKTN